MTLVYGTLYKIEKVKIILTDKNGQLKSNVVVENDQSKAASLISKQ